MACFVKRIRFWMKPKRFNTSYLTDSYIGFTLNLESGQNFCSDRSIRSSTYGKKKISDFPPCGKLVIFVTEFVIFLKTTKSNELIENGSRIEEFQNFFFTIFSWPNRPVGAKILSGFQLEGKTDVWISQVRRVKYILRITSGKIENRPIEGCTSNNKMTTIKWRPNGCLKTD